MDHRGIPEKPGRVVTLLPTNDPDLLGDLHGDVPAEAQGGPARPADERCWGRAFEVAPADQKQVLEELDHRERGGYERVDVSIEFDVGSEREPCEGLLYVATKANPNYLGPASIEALADQIATAVGPSGPNPEYVFELATSLREMGAVDTHVFALEAALRARTPNQ